MARITGPVLVVFVLLSVLVLWGVGELFTSEEGAAVSPGFQTVVFAMISVMTVVLITIFLKTRKREGKRKNDDTEH